MREKSPHSMLKWISRTYDMSPAALARMFQRNAQTASVWLNCTSPKGRYSERRPAGSVPEIYFRGCAFRYSPRYCVAISKELLSYERPTRPEKVFCSRSSQDASACGGT